MEPEIIYDSPLPHVELQIERKARVSQRKDGYPAPTDLLLGRAVWSSSRTHHAPLASYVALVDVLTLQR